MWWPMTSPSTASPALITTATRSKGCRFSGQWAGRPPSPCRKPAQIPRPPRSGSLAAMTASPPSAQTVSVPPRRVTNDSCCPSMIIDSDKSIRSRATKSPAAVGCQGAVARHASGKTKRTVTSRRLSTGGHNRPFHPRHVCRHKGAADAAVHDEERAPGEKCAPLGDEGGAVQPRRPFYPGRASATNRTQPAPPCPVARRRATSARAPSRATGRSVKFGMGCRAARTSRYPASSITPQILHKGGVGRGIGPFVRHKEQRALQRQRGADLRHAWRRFVDGHSVSRWRAVGNEAAAAGSDQQGQRGEQRQEDK